MQISTHNTRSILNQKEITLEEVFDKLLLVVSLMKRNYVLIGIIVLLSVVGGILTRGDKIYTSTVTILLPSSAETGVLSLVSQFGGGSKKGVTFKKFKSIAGSSSNLKKVLLSRSEIGDTNDINIHFLIDELELRKLFSEQGSSLATVDFNKQGFRQDTVLNYVIKALRERLLIQETIDELIKVEITGKNELLAVIISEEIVNQALAFFDKSSVAEDFHTMENLILRRDSTKALLFREEMHLATLKDAAVRTVKSKGYIALLRSERAFNILNGTYMELIKQITMLSFKIDNSRHNISVVDSPMLPLDGKKKGIVKTSIIFSIIGFVVSILLLIGAPLGLKVFKKVKKA